jgi:nucleotide-binding universal stress UspA family protein
MSPIITALNSGYSASRILQFLQKTDPQLALKINNALQAGHSIESVLKFMDKNGKNISALMKPKEEETGPKNIYKHAEESVHPAIKGAAKFGGAVAATGLGAYALSRALPQAAQALQGELLPALPKSPAQALQLEGQAAKQLPFIEAEAQAIKPPPSPTQPQAPIPQQAQIAQQAAAQIKPLPESLQKQVSKLAEIGNDANQIEGYLEKFHPKEVKAYEKATNTPIRSAIEEFSRSLPGKMQTQPMATGVQEAKQPIEAKVSEPIQPVKEKQDLSEIGGMAKGMMGNFYEGIFKSLKEGKDTFSGVKDPLIAKAKPLFEKGLIRSPEDLKEFVNNPDKFKEVKKIVALPNGDIGEITNIRQDIATVNSNGKEYRRKLDELEEAPEGLEEATRHLVNLIPEKEKSTAFQESIHLTIPGMEGKEMPIMLTKYYDGKWAWYLDVSNDDYSKIALGTYEPKTKKKTGIGEYKPGIIDSRGAGNSELIIQNPKYSKANKGITWGYSDTKYDMLRSIQETLKKMSREELDEEGNIKQKREKSVGKSSASPGLPKSQHKKRKKIT